MATTVRTLREPRAARTIRAELLAIAGAAAKVPQRTAILRLVHPHLSEHRIEEEWQLARSVLRPAVLSRISLQVEFEGDRLRTFGGQPGLPPAPREPHPRPAGLISLPPRDVAFAVEKLLVWAWLTGAGPLTRKRVEDMVGCSYPTVAAVVKRLGGAVRRHRDRRIELDHLPREEWARLFARSSEARCTMRFADRSGEPGSAVALQRRLAQVAPVGVALGGVAGARHHRPEIDIVGLPRLDLSVHAPGKDADIGFVRRLDPALQPVQDAREPALLVLHFNRHRDALFGPGPGGVPVADPVECLLDLHECGLEAQALEFLDALTPRGRVEPARRPDSEQLLHVD